MLCGGLSLFQCRVRLTIKGLLAGNRQLGLSFKVILNKNLIYLSEAMIYAMIFFSYSSNFSVYFDIITQI